jgi:transposase
VPPTLSAPAPVVIAIDPHKASWTAVAVDTRLEPLATIRTGSTVTATGNCAASPAAGHKPAGQSKAQPVVIGEATAALRTLTEHRDDMVRTRTQTISRLRALLTQLVPAGSAPRADR